MKQLTNSNNTTLFFNTRDELTKVVLDKVAYFEADANYCHVFFINGAKATILISLANIEEILNDKIKETPFAFIRVGKRHIINSRLIFKINTQKQRLWLTNFESPTVFEIPISKEALKNLKYLYTDKSQWK